MFGKMLDFLDKILTFFEEWTLFITVIVALVALFVNVVLRYGFNYSLAWSEELVREVIIYTTFIGCSAAVKNRSMIKIDASVQLLPKLKMPLTYFSNFVIMIFAGMMIYYGAADDDASASHPAENHHHGNSSGHPLCHPAVDGSDDADSSRPSHLSGCYRTTLRETG